MRHLILSSILVLTLLSACAPAGPSSAEATLIALSVQLTVEAQATEEPTVAVTEIPPSAAPTVAPVLPTEVPTETETPEPAEEPEEAEEVFEVPDWPLFRLGDEGPEVYAIQHLLRSHGYNLTVDGKFGPQTRSEVRNLQIAKGLGADGIVGPNTWAALIQGKQIDQGDSGQAVRALQVLLRDKFGYNSVNVDADFGPITDSAVRDFQEEYDLIVDGIVGPDTWKALVSIEP
jgi:peptidoglycan hydrolase-like protein with peptidoglycan-binding domain